jgi:hypothetical protein
MEACNDVLVDKRAPEAAKSESKPVIFIVSLRVLIFAELVINIQLILS